MSEVDVFISYAHADDERMSERARGWVTQFAERLQTAVRMKQGGGRVRVWMDQRLEPQKAVDAELAKRVAASACFVAVMSPRYLESDWCRREIDTFVRRVGGGGSGDRVFLAEFLPTDRAAWHPAIRSITPVPFWSRSFDEPAPMTLGFPAPDPEGDKPYWNTLNRLAQFLAEQVNALGAGPAAPAAEKPRVWIADPTDDLADHWDSLADAVRQEGGEVLPAAPGTYAYAAHAEPGFRAALDADLSRSRLLVQLLGPHPGRRLPWPPRQSLGRLQADAARAQAALRRVPYLAWRPSEVRLDDIADADHRALLTGAVAGGFEEFRRQVLDALLRPPAPPAPPAPTATAATAAEVLAPDEPISVCVTASEHDRALGTSVLDLLQELDVDASLTPEPSERQTPAQWRQECEAMLAASRGALILYGQAPPSWVQTQAQAVRKALAQRAGRGVWGALLDLPPPGKPDPGLRMRNLMLLDCRGGLARAPLERFVNRLRGDA